MLKRLLRKIWSVRILQAKFAIVREPMFWDREILSFIITTCVIIANEHGKDLNYTFSGLMGKPVRFCRRQNRVRRFLETYHDIRDPDTHGDIQKDIMKE